MKISNSVRSAKVGNNSLMKTNLWQMYSWQRLCRCIPKEKAFKDSPHFILLAKRVPFELSSLDMRNINGNAPFHLACFLWNFQIVQRLLKKWKKHKVNVVSVNNIGKDGQDDAEQRGHTDIVALTSVTSEAIQLTSVHEIVHLHGLRGRSRPFFEKCG